jgi:hypothetical protein
MTSSASTPAREIRYAVAPERMPAIPEEKMSAAQKRAVADICAGPRGGLRGPYVAILRSPGLMGPTQKSDGARATCRTTSRSPTTS